MGSQWVPGFAPICEALQLLLEMVYDNIDNQAQFKKIIKVGGSLPKYPPIPTAHAPCPDVWVTCLCAGMHC